MIYSDKFQLIYYPIFKTGSRSLRELLMLLFDDMNYHGETHDRKTPKSMSDYSKISMVRNPYQRAISMWSHFHTATTHPYQEVKEMKFEEFMEWLVKHPKVKTDVLLMNQYNYLMGIELSAVYKLEDLSESLPKFNIGKHRAIHTKRTKELVWKWAMADYDFYGY